MPFLLLEVTLIIVIIMIIAHVARLVVGMQKTSKSEAPSAIVIQPKEKPKKEIKKKKRASLACKHRSNYNLPSKLMVVDIEVNKETINEVSKKKKEKEKEVETANLVTSMIISAPPAYKTLKPTGPEQATLLTVPPLEKPGSSMQSAQNSAVNSAEQSPNALTPSGGAERERKSGSTIVSKTIQSETCATPSTTGEKK